MSETPLAAEVRDWTRETVRLSGECPWCHALVNTVGPRGGKVWTFDHYAECLFLRIYHALRGESS